MIEAIRGKFRQMEKMVKDVRTEFETVIKDTTISLDDRWKLFKQAPEELRGTDSWIWVPDTFAKYNKDWEDLAWVERYKVINVIDRIDGYEGEDLIVIDGEEGIYQDPEWILELKEEVLRLNIGSFTFDW